MEKLKKIVYYISLAIVGFVFIVGGYHVIKLFVSINKIKKEGQETICIIKNKWRGKCGYGYGNSATFSLIIDGKEVDFVSDCNVPDEVQVGDKFSVKYLKEDPSKNLILFELKVN